MTNLLRRCAAEALGTFALVAIGAGSVMVAARTHAFGQSGIALAFGVAVTIVVASTGHLGGAHVNPAVTIGFWSIKRFRGADVLPYVAAQCLGATLASLFYGWLLGPIGSFGATQPSLPIAQSFTVGFLGTRSSSWESPPTHARRPRWRRSRSARRSWSVPSSLVR